METHVESTDNGVVCKEIGESGSIASSADAVDLRDGLVVVNLES